MIQPVRGTLDAPAPGPFAEVRLERVLARECVAWALPVTGKRELLENLAALLLQAHAGLSYEEVSRHLVEHEQEIGTGIGHGIALPHARVAGLERAVGAFVTLARPLDYGAGDRQPVRMAFALLAPARDGIAHLNILARLAVMFSDATLRARLRAARNAPELYALVTEWDRHHPAAP